jgi:hypothetical protein
LIADAPSTKIIGGGKDNCQSRGTRLGIGSTFVAIVVVCRCGRQYETPVENAGRRVTCPTCARSLKVPVADSVDVPEIETASRVSSRRAVASLLLGLSALLLMFITGIMAIVAGLTGLYEIKKSRGRIGGAWMAFAGIALGTFGCTVLPFMILPPLVHDAIEARSNYVCEANLYRIAQAMRKFHHERGSLPPGAITDRQGRPLLSWRVAILPYLGPDEAALFEKFQLDEPWDSPKNARLASNMPDVFACPSDGNRRQTRYQLIVGPRALYDGLKPRKIVDLQTRPLRKSDTLLVGEGGKPVDWTSPRDHLYDTNLPALGLRSGHRDGFHLAMIDGSIDVCEYTMENEYLLDIIYFDKR